MFVSIEFLGRQRIITNTPSIKMPITEEARVADALEYVKHRYPDLNLNEAETLITVNQEMTSLDRVLRANDTVSFLPFIHGG
jgi:molybdopterin converting factor small subunit